MVQSIDPFASTKGRLGRAKKLISDFVLGEREYQDSKPLERFEEINDLDGYRIVKVRLVKPIPQVLTDLVYDAIHNLRAALDQVLTPLTIDGKRCTFPFSGDASNFAGIIASLSNRLPQEITDLLRTFATYKAERPPIRITGYFLTIPEKQARECLERQRGPDPSHVLCSLNDLNNLNKHEVTRPVGFASYDFHCNFQGVEGLRFNMPRWNAEKAEMELYQLAPDGRIESGLIQVECSVALTGVEAVEGAIASNKPNEFFDEAEKIVLSIEETALKNKLI